MTTYTLAIEHAAERRIEVKAYSTPTNAIDGLEGVLAGGGAVISAILRNGVLIDEGMLRDDEEFAATIKFE